MTLDPDIDRPIEDVEMYREPDSRLFHPLDDVQKVQAEINIMEKEDYDAASEYSYPAGNPFHENTIIMTAEPDLAGHSWTPSVPETTGNILPTPPVVKKETPKTDTPECPSAESTSAQVTEPVVNDDSSRQCPSTLMNANEGELVKDSLSVDNDLEDDDDENSEIVRIMNRPASKQLQLSVDQMSSVCTGMSSRRKSFLTKEIDALANFPKLGVPLKIKNSFKKLGGLFKNRKKETVIDEGEFIPVEKQEPSDVESGLAYYTPPDGVHPDEVLAPGIPDEFLDDFAVLHNIEGEEDDKFIPDDREVILDEVLSEASEPQTKKANL
ncbi:Oidioi.mRNA.OKI2018_I69.PAR.g10563.t1.cds [Oikopleura dioica]|uniref:Oidioi.mRNA.OKI2018_I69.PAR.g10563.t1.cds n=1 Tax=Oikopleura dioica TaxID=34765 RepID=A0ABN7RR53_OIKDI|nr:Oidioi.mRNA.OKI2018_I69.PAR.g10563.t1.cds [Oikopleura dioica]